MTRLDLELLGAPRVAVDGAAVGFDTRKATALLAYLAVTGRAHTRNALAALLWPDYDPEHARGALRRTLSTLRKPLGADRLEVDRQSVGLVLDGGTVIDVRRFRELVGNGEADDREARLAEAVALYRADFMAGFSLRDSLGFDDWQELEAASLRDELAGALDRLVLAHAARREWEAAIDHSRRRLALEPLHEPAQRELIKLLAWSGQRAAALRQYRECVRLLNRDLGVRPVEETTALFRQLREDRLPPPPEPPPARAAETSTVPEAPAGARAPEGARAREAFTLPERPPRLPLVGRREDLAGLVEAHAVARAGRLAVIEGEAGVGKTRLAEELLAEVRRGGTTVLAAACHEGESSLAYGPFAEALRRSLGDPAARRRMVELPAPVLAETVRLVPELAELGTELPAGPPLDAPGAHDRFLHGLFETILALCAGEPPGVLFLDDLQWADDASLDLVTYVVHRLGGRPLLVLATWRAEDVPSQHRLRRLLDEACKTGRGTALTLERLGRPEVIELVGSVSTGGSDVAETIWEETEGLPFYVAEYVAAVEADPARPPPGLLGARELLRSRLAGVSELGGQLLATAAVVGRSFSFDVLHEASGRSEEETVEALEELARRGLVREVDAPAGPGWDFNHEKLRALVYEETSLARRRLLHRRVAESLERRAARGAGEDALAAVVAHHLRLGGEETRAADWLERAGRHSRSLFANAEALAHFGAALALGPRDPAAVHESIGDVEKLMGDYRAALESFETAAAQREGAALARLEHKLGDLHQRRGDWALAAAHLEAALELLDSDSVALRARLQADRSLNARRCGHDQEARELAEEALTLADEAADTGALAQAHNMLGMLAGDTGARDAARAHLERSVSLAQELDDPSARIAALNNLALECAAGGDYDRSLALAQTALDLCVAQGDRHRQAALHNNLSDLLRAAGRPDEGMDHLKRAVALFAEVGGDDEMQPEIWKLVEW